jgi:hypothetical protein
MGLFDSIKDAMRSDDADAPGPNGDAGEAKHVDRSAPVEMLEDFVDPGVTTGGKHARRD